MANHGAPRTNFIPEFPAVFVNIISETKVFRGASVAFSYARSLYFCCIFVIAKSNRKKRRIKRHSTRPPL